MGYVTPNTGKINQKLGEHPSVFDYGAVGNGSTDDGPAFNKGIADVIGSGAGTLWIPGGYTYAINTNIEIPSGSTNLTLAGDGASSQLLRTGNFSASMTGVIYVGTGCSFITFRDFLVDGAVTTSVGKQYGGSVTSPQFGNNPTNLQLVGNSSFFIDGLSSNISFDGITVQHTGGYSILFYAINGFMQNLTVVDCVFQNNRPHLFGTTLGDLNYGSFTGGVFCAGDASSSGTATCVVDNFVVDKCTFLRNTGNCSWTHGNGIFGMHTNVRMTNNYFQDIGLDGVLFQCVSGGVRSGNTLRRVGYICSDDTSPSVPKYLVNFNATAIDSGGIVSGVSTSNNSVMSVNGGCLDMDGCQDEVVSGNMFKLPLVGDLEYTEDSIASLPPNVQYGTNPGNTIGAATVGRNITIAGNTFINLGAGAVRLGGCNSAVVSGNSIQHPAGAAFAPILLFNLGTSDKAVNCSISGNIINWNPTTAAAGVLETTAYTSVPWLSTDKNWIGGNHLFGNCFEFTKDPTSGSVVGVLINSTATATGASSDGNFSGNMTYDGANIVVPGSTSNPGLTVGAGYVLSHEGFATASSSGAAVNAPNGTILGDIVAAGTNLSLAQAASTPLGVHAQAKIYVDSSNNLVANVNNNGPVNLLSGSSGVTGLVQYSAGAGAFASSTTFTFASGTLTLSGGVGTGVIAALFNANAGGSNLEFQGSNFSVTGTGQIATNGFLDLGLTTAPATAALHAHIFYNTVSLVNLLQFTIDAATAPSLSISAAGITAPVVAANKGGTNIEFQGSQMSIAGNGHIATNGWLDYGLVSSATILAAQGTGHALIGYSSVSAVNTLQFFIDGTGSAPASLQITSVGVTAPILSASASSGTALSVNGGTASITAAGAGAFQSVAANGMSIAAANNSTVGLNVTTGYVYADGGFATNSSASAAVNVPNGTVQSKFLTTTDSLIFAQEAAPSLSITGQSRIYMDSTSHILMVSMNGGSYAALVSSGGSAAGSTTQIQFNNGSGTFGASSSFTWSGTAVTAPAYTTSGTSGSFTSTSTGANVGYSNNGSAGAFAGIYGNGQIAGQWLALADRTAPTASAGNAFLYATSTGLFLSLNGGSYNQVATTNGVVTSLTASTGIFVNASTGAITITNTGVISLAASGNLSVSGSGSLTVSLTATPSFSTVATTGVMNGASFQNGGGSFAVDSSGNLDSLTLSIGSSHSQFTVNSAGTVFAAGVITANTGILSNGGIKATGFTGPSGSNGISQGPAAYTTFIFSGGICTFAS